MCNQQLVIFILYSNHESFPLECFAVYGTLHKASDFQTLGRKCHIQNTELKILVYHRSFSDAL